MRSIRALFRKPLAACLLAALIMLGQAGGASGRPGDPAPPDTAATKGRPVFGFLTPNYTTNYSVSRGETVWDQKFNFSNDWKEFSFKNDTSYSIKTDPKRPGFKVRNGNTQNTLGYLLLERIPLTSHFSYSRSGQVDAIRESNTDLLDADIGSSYAFRLRRFRNTIDATVGLSKRIDTQLLAGSRLTTTDFGLTRRLALGTYLPGPLTGMTSKLDGVLRLEGSDAKATEGLGSLQGSVSMPSTRTPVPKAYVQILRPGSLEPVQSDSTGAVTSDQTGRRFVFADLPPGNYDVRVTATGFEPVTRRARVQVEQTTDLGDIPLSVGFHSSFSRIELAGDLQGNGLDYDPTRRVAMQNLYGGVWQVELRNVGPGTHRIKFLTGDPRGDYGSDEPGCPADRVLGRVVLSTGGENAICASFTAGGAFRVTLNEEALLFRVETLKADESGPKNNADASLTGVFTYSPIPAITSDLNISTTHKTDSYIIVSNDPALKGRREEVTNNATNGTWKLSYRPPNVPTTELTVSATGRYSALSKLVDVSRASTLTASSFDARARRLIFGTQANLHFEQDKDDDRPRNRVASKTLTRVLDGALDRPVGPRMTLRTAAELRLRRQTYRDGVQDSDDLRSRLEVGMTYRPDTSLVGTVSGTRTLRDARSISAAQSVNTRYEETYTVSFGVEWSVTPRTRLSQKYNYQPIFTTNRFDASRDRLDRSRDVRTSVSTYLNPRLSLELRHYFRLQEGGGYRRAPDGTRLFGVGDKNYTQDLTTSLVWKPTTWLNFRTDERFYRLDLVRVQTNKRQATARLEFTQAASFQRPLPGGGKVQADFGFYTQTALKPVAGIREHYVTANVSLNKEF